MSVSRFPQKSGDLGEGGYTYYWSVCPQGHFEGVAAAVADRLVPIVTEVTPVKERIMRQRISHTLRVLDSVNVRMGYVNSP